MCRKQKTTAERNGSDTVTLYLLNVTKITTWLNTLLILGILVHIVHRNDSLRFVGVRCRTAHILIGHHAAHVHERVPDLFDGGQVRVHTPCAVRHCIPYLPRRIVGPVRVEQHRAASSSWHAMGCGSDYHGLETRFKKGLSRTAGLQRGDIRLWGQYQRRYTHLRTYTHTHTHARTHNHITTLHIHNHPTTVYKAWQHTHHCPVWIKMPLRCVGTNNLAFPSSPRT